MQFVGLIIILLGLYLIDSGVRNRPPIKFIKALIDDPSDLTYTLRAMNGTWDTSLGQGRKTLLENSKGSSTTTPGADKTLIPSGTTGSSGVSGRPAGVTGSNGQLSADQLAKLSWTGARIHKNAAPSFEQLNQAFKSAFGKNIAVTDGYRTYAQQVAVKAAKGRLAGTPGTSNHGWGHAVDLGSGINTFGSKEHNWMMNNAGRFGWTNPSWARAGGSKPEPWHWEFTGAK